MSVTQEPSPYPTLPQLLHTHTHTRTHTHTVSHNPSHAQSHTYRHIHGQTHSHTHSQLKTVTKHKMQSQSTRVTHMIRILVEFAKLLDIFNLYCRVHQYQNVKLQSHTQTCALTCTYRTETVHLYIHTVQIHINRTLHSYNMKYEEAQKTNQHSIPH